MEHPCKFQRASRLGNVTARHSSIGHQPNFAALNRAPSVFYRAAITLGIGPYSSSLFFVVVALWNRADHYIFALWFLSFFFYLFSERTHVHFAICCRPSVCRLSVVCNIRAPYSGGSNFRQYFYGIGYLGHPLTFTENFVEIVPGEPLRRGS